MDGRLSAVEQDANLHGPPFCNVTSGASEGTAQRPNDGAHFDEQGCSNAAKPGVVRSGLYFCFFIVLSLKQIKKLSRPKAKAFAQIYLLKNQIRKKLAGTHPDNGLKVADCFPPLKPRNTLSHHNKKTAH